jgi:mono/diheme cytochrome c family protein
MTLASMNSSTAPNTSSHRAHELIPSPIVILFIILSLSSFACCQDPPFSQPLILGGVAVSPETLNLGHKIYANHCFSCHGPLGQGNGPFASNPPPRDLSLGVFFYKSTSFDALPTHPDLTRTISLGIPSSPMPPFLGTLSPQEISNVAYFIKTFSKRWRVESPPPPLPSPPNPWPPSDLPQAIQLGRKLYHSSALCWRCHPSYIPPALLSSWLSESSNRTHEQIDNDIKSRLLLAPLDKPTPMHTPFGPMLPTDLLSARMRAGSTDADLYRTLAVGIPSLGMSGLHEILSPSEIWSLIHYIRRLQNPSSHSQP